MIKLIGTGNVPGFLTFASFGERSKQAGDFFLNYFAKLILKNIPDPAKNLINLFSQII